MYIYLSMKHCVENPITTKNRTISPIYINTNLILYIDLVRLS